MNRRILAINRLNMTLALDILLDHLRSIVRPRVTTVRIKSRLGGYHC